MKRFFIVVSIYSAFALLNESVSQEIGNTVQMDDNLMDELTIIRQTEQRPIRQRDSLIAIYGADSKEAEVYQKIYRKNHAVNIEKVNAILQKYGWPEPNMIGDLGNLTLCNVLQHDDLETREYYLPLMRQAVKDKKLEPSFLARAEDRIATDKGEFQRYGGQMKYYPETKSFNVWPIFEPDNIDTRRAAIGLGPIAEHLMNRFGFEWDLEEQIKRSKEFEKNKN